MSGSGLAATRPGVPFGPATVAVRTRLRLETLAGTLGLMTIAACSLWLAARAAAGGYLLHLPGGRHPGWIEGPLQGLGRALGPADAQSFSVAVSVMAAGYAAALAFARALPHRLVLAAVAIATVVMTLGPTLVSSDVFGYLAYARLEVLHGLNPYVSPPLAAPADPIIHLVFWRAATSPYGPLFTLLSAPFGLLSPAAALWTYKALAGAAAIALALLVGRAAPTVGADPRRAVVFVALNPVVLIYAVSGAHNDLFGALLLTTAIVLALRGRAAAAGGVAVAAAAIKLTLGLAVPFVLVGASRQGRLRGGARTLVGAAAAALVTALVTMALFGTHVIDQLHRIMADPRFDIAWSGPDRVAYALGSGLNSTIRAGCTAAAALIAVAALVWGWRRGDWITALGWATLALLASIASLAPWYLAWMLPVAALSRGRALRVAALLATAYLLATHLPALGGHPWLSGLR